MSVPSRIHAATFSSLILSILPLASAKPDEFRMTDIEVCILEKKSSTSSEHEGTLQGRRFFSEVGKLTGILYRAPAQITSAKLCVEKREHRVDVRRSTLSALRKGELGFGVNCTLVGMPNRLPLGPL